MEVLCIVFMVFVVITAMFAMFAMLIVVRDIARESANKKQQPAPQVIVQTVAPEKKVEKKEVAPVKEEVKEEVAVAVADATDDEDKVSFSASNQQTLEEKYLELSAQAKGWYDEIAKKATVVENSKRVKNARYEEYKVGNSRIVRLLIKRGVVFCEFKLQNSEFSNFVSKNKISVKQSATLIKIVDDAACDVAKNTIDIVLQQIEQEKQYKKQLAREKRREKREQENN